SLHRFPTRRSSDLDTSDGQVSLKENARFPDHWRRHVNRHQLLSFDVVKLSPVAPPEGSHVPGKSPVITAAVRDEPFPPGVRKFRQVHFGLSRFIRDEGKPPAIR